MSAASTVKQDSRRLEVPSTWQLGDIWFSSLVVRLFSSHRPGKCTSKINPINEELAHKKAVMSRSIYEKTSPESGQRGNLPQQNKAHKWQSERKVKVNSVVSDSLQPHGLYSPWNSPGQNTGVGSLSLLQGIFPTQESNPGLPHCKRILYQLSYQVM